MDASGYDHAAFIPEFYDHVVPYVARADVRFYVEAARECGGPVLELGCGTGRILVPTARAGVGIAGLDASEGMLDTCRHRLRAEPTEVQGRASLRCGDMRDFDLGRTFRLVTIPFRPFQHLITVAEQLACLGAIRRHLATDGRLVFDLFNPSIHNLAKSSAFLWRSWVTSYWHRARLEWRWRAHHGRTVTEWVKAGRHWLEDPAG